MPLIDVSDVFYDPNFTETDGIVQYIRGTYQVDATGRNTIVWTQPIELDNTIVQPAGGAALRLIPDLTRVDLSIDVYTQTRLLATTDTTVADRILYQGKTYIVRLVEDFSRYGSGYVYALCEMLQTTEDGP